MIKEFTRTKVSNNDMEFTALLSFSEKMLEDYKEEIAILEEWDGMLGEAEFSFLPMIGDIVDFKDVFKEEDIILLERDFGTSSFLIEKRIWRLKDKGTLIELKIYPHQLSDEEKKTEVT